MGMTGACRQERPRVLGRVELDEEAQRTERLDFVRFLGRDNAGRRRIEDRFARRVEIGEAQTAFDDVDHSPDAGLGAVALPYRRTPVFTETTLPAALR